MRVLTLSLPMSPMPPSLMLGLLILARGGSGLVALIWVKQPVDEGQSNCSFKLHRCSPKY